MPRFPSLRRSGPAVPPAPDPGRVADLCAALIEVARPLGLHVAQGVPPDLVFPPCRPEGAALADLGGGAVEMLVFDGAAWPMLAAEDARQATRADSVAQRRRVAFLQANLPLVPLRGGDDLIEEMDQVDAILRIGLARQAEA